MQWLQFFTVRAAHARGKAQGLSPEILNIGSAHRTGELSCDTRVQSIFVPQTVRIKLRRQTPHSRRCPESRVWQTPICCIAKQKRKKMFKQLAPWNIAVVAVTAVVVLSAAGSAAASGQGQIVASLYPNGRTTSLSGDSLNWPDISQRQPRVSNHATNT